MKIAEVYLNQTNKRIDRVYDYLIPRDLEPVVLPGMRIMVGFGRGDRQLEGFVIKVKAETAFPDKIKAITQIVDCEPILNQAQIALCLYMKQAYCSLFYEGLCYFTTPVKTTKKMVPDPKDPRKTIWCSVPYAAREKLWHLKMRGEVRGPVQKKLLELLENRDFTRQEMKDLFGEVASSLRSLEKKGFIESYERDIRVREMTEVYQVLPQPEEKASELYALWQQTKVSGKPAYLFCTAESVRLSLYFLAIQACLENGRTACLMFPEISLSLEIKEQLYRRFGNAVALCHGQMSQKERYRIYAGVKNGQIKVVAGSRAAFFMPLENLGVIIVDEQRDPSYYAASMPRFNVVTLAEKMAALTGTSLLCADTIPALSGLKRIEVGEWSALGTMTALPFSCEVVDMQQEMRAGNYDFMSRSLRKHLDSTLDSGGMPLLLLNRRGYSTYVFCRDCGHVEKCPTCGVALRDFGHHGQLGCPYCGYIQDKPSSCPECGSKKIRALGLGIEQVWEQLKKRYPHKRILKVDSEAVPDYDTFCRINAELDAGLWDMVIGTRLLLRNFHVKNVTLAAALLIDGDMNHGDFTSAENTWQLYSRFFGKLCENGMALIQTYEPEAPLVEAFAQGDSQLFYASEQSYRRLMGYPPEKEMVVFDLLHEDTLRVQRDSQCFYERLAACFENVGGITLLKPIKAGLVRKTGQTCYRMVLKAKDLSEFYNGIEKLIDEGAIEKLEAKVSIAINPPAI